MPEFINNESYFVDGTAYNYVNETLTTTDVEIGNFKVDFTFLGGGINSLELNGIKFNNNDDYLRFRKANKIKITGTKFSDGIKTYGFLMMIVK